MSDWRWLCSGDNFRWSRVSTGNVHWGISSRLWGRMFRRCPLVHHIRSSFPWGDRLSGWKVGIPAMIVCTLFIRWRSLGRTPCFSHCFLLFELGYSMLVDHWGFYIHYLIEKKTPWFLSNGRQAARNVGSWSAEA